MVAVFSAVQAGALKVLTTNGSAHDPLVWGTMCANRVIEIADTAEPAIQEQARAFRERLRQTVAHYVREATKDRLTHLATELERAGMREAAALIRSKEV